MEVFLSTSISQWIEINRFGDSLPVQPNLFSYWRWYQQQWHNNSNRLSVATIGFCRYRGFCPIYHPKLIVIELHPNLFAEGHESRKLSANKNTKCFLSWNRSNVVDYSISLESCILLVLIQSVDSFHGFPILAGCQVYTINFSNTQPGTQTNLLPLFEDWNIIKSN